MYHSSLKWKGSEIRISHNYKFVFLANPRTGSTSTRDILDPYTDIYSVHKQKTTKEFPFYHHISALELKKVFDEKKWDWDEYTKFTVIRNPYDRVVSLWHHHQWMMTRPNLAVQDIQTFEDYVNQIDPNARLTTSLNNFINDDNGNQLIDNIIRFENMEEALPDFMKLLNIPVKSLVIPKLNSSKKRNDYKTYYNNKTYDHVTKLYQDDINRFSYTF